MASQNQGIQTLLEAEKDAAKVVQEARQYRIQRLKDAHTEADKEIEEYRSEKQKEFEKFKRSREGIIESTQSSVDRETENKLGDLDDFYKENNQAALEKLIARILMVVPELHRNYKRSDVLQAA